MIQRLIWLDRFYYFLMLKQLSRPLLCQICVICEVRLVLISWMFLSFKNNGSKGGRIFMVGLISFRRLRWTLQFLLMKDLPPCLFVIEAVYSCLLGSTFQALATVKLFSYAQVQYIILIQSRKMALPASQYFFPGHRPMVTLCPFSDFINKILLIMFFKQWLGFQYYIIVKMRYQSKPYRSVSYTQQQALRDSKENKENNNVINLPQAKLNRPSKDYELPCKLKLQHKISETTNCTLPFAPKQSLSEQLKATYTEMIRKEYSTDILSHLCTSSPNHNNILANHAIGSSLRSKMVDWMIEVLSSYKMSEETFFRSVYFMDAYLRCSQSRLEVKDLHLIGVTTMFAAAKYEEIHPLKLSVVYDKIARKKFRKDEILQKESQIIGALDFQLEVPSVYDISRHAVEEMRMALSEQSSKYFNKILLYLSKMTLFSCELAEESTPLLAAAVVFISLKTLEQVDSSAEPEKKLGQICELVGCEEQGVIEVSRKVLDLAKNFSKCYPSLTNLKKFNKFEYGSE